MTSASEQSSDETVSYSEEEIMDVDDTNNNENEQAIDAMLEENERLEEQENAFLTAKRSGTRFFFISTTSISLYIARARNQCLIESIYLFQKIFGMNLCYEKGS